MVMKARIIKNENDVIQLLCNDGTIKNFSEQLLAKFVTNFNSETYVNRLTGKEGVWNTEVFDMSDYPGETMAYITDQYQMVLISPTLFEFVVSSVSPASENVEHARYIMISEYAKKVNRSEIMIRKFCQEGRIPGARKDGIFWLVPENTPYPIPPTKRRK